MVYFLRQMTDLKFGLQVRQVITLGMQTVPRYLTPLAAHLTGLCSSKKYLLASSLVFCYVEK